MDIQTILPKGHRIFLEYIKKPARVMGQQRILSSLSPEHQSICLTIKRRLEEGALAVEELMIRTTREEEATRMTTPPYSSPIYRLPTSILKKIFGFTSSDITDNVFGVRKIWESNTVALSGVCRHWRQITVNSPLLWSNFSLDLRFRDRILPILEVFLNRSKKSPLSFYLTVPSDYYGGDGDFDPFFLLLDEQPRWRYFNIDTLHDFVLERLWRFLLTPFPVLESSSFQEGLIDYPVSSHPFPDAPNFQSITLRYEEFAQSFEVWLQSLPRLDRFSYITFEAEETIPVTDLMRAASQLQSFTFQGSLQNVLKNSHRHPRYIRIPSGFAPVECTNLASITINIAVKHTRKPTYDILHDFFAAVSAPKLESLTIFAHRPHVDVDIFNWPRYVMRKFAERSGQRLKSLAVKDIPVDDRDLLAFLEVLPTIEELTVHDHCVWRKTFKPDFFRDLLLEEPPFHRTITKSFLKALIWSSERVFVPKLHTIRLQVRHGKYFDGQAELVEMVGSRFVNGDSSVAKLRVVELSGWQLTRGLSQASYEPLKEWERKGLMVSVVSENYPHPESRVYIV
ncbi:hypothetical protein L218DRAFT_114539 [Marasmius fiardii PR-910]|nr:hypothetical protein L218DRAFT_114539 [Marasmius fiardii PR-910]